MPAAMKQVGIEDIRQWPATVPLTQGGAAFGYGANGCYAAYQRGDFPVRVLKVGRRLRVSTADVLSALGVTAVAER